MKSERIKAAHELGRAVKDMLEYMENPAHAVTSGNVLAVNLNGAYKRYSSACKIHAGIVAMKTELIQKMIPHLYEQDGFIMCKEEGRVIMTTREAWSESMLKNSDFDLCEMRPESSIGLRVINNPGGTGLMTVRSELVGYPGIYAKGSFYLSSAYCEMIRNGSRGLS